MFGPRVLSEAEIVRLPRPAAPGITPTSFTPCPVQFGQAMSPEQWAMQQQLYQLAFE